jgi:hypothetical protein
MTQSTVDLEAPSRLAESSRIARWLTSPRVPWLASAIALLLGLPSIGFGFTTDDHVLRLLIERDGRAFSLFDISNPLVREALQDGALSWWTNRGSSCSTLRPRSCRCMLRRPIASGTA